VHIHVKGEKMPNSLFLRILDMMKQFYDKKTIVFVVYNADMKQLVKDSVPSSLYVRVDLCKEEGLRRAG
jgi:hypothetical protein